jgi:hypothetical protein
MVRGHSVQVTLRVFVPALRESDVELLVLREILRNNGSNLYYKRLCRLQLMSPRTPRALAVLLETDHGALPLVFM